MAGTSTRTKVITARIACEDAEALEIEAAEAGATVSSLVAERVKRGGLAVSDDLGPGVYMIQAGEDGPVKIGWSKRLASRLPALQTGSPVRLLLIRAIQCETWVEGWFHHQFDDQRLEGEWFTFSPSMYTLEPPVERPPVTGGNINGQSERLAFRCPADLAAELHALAAGGSLSEVIVDRLRRCAVVETRYQALLASDPTLPRW